MRPGQVERRTHDYVRHGTTTLFAALDTATGKVIGQCFPRHRAREFLAFLRTLETQVPGDLEVHLVMDNYATHKTPGARLVNVGDPWLLVRAKAGLDGVRIHDLRHSWASRALALGESLSMIGKLLGHSRIDTTARYAHLERDTEKVSAAKVGGSIGTDILKMEGSEGSPWPS